MKKIIVLVAVLVLMAGAAYAADYSDGMARQVYAQTKGRTTVSDSAVMMRLWYDGSGANPAIGASANTTITLYSDYDAGTVDTVFTTSNANSNTVGEVVASANSVSGWHAEAGPDGYDALSTNGVISTNYNHQHPGRNEPECSNVYLNTELSDVQICGVNPEANKISRIKKIIHFVSGSGDVRLRVKSGDATVWEEQTGITPYNTAAGVHCSPVTVTFTDTGEKGIAGDMGKPLCVEVHRYSGILSPVYESSGSTVSIMYDQF